MLFYTGGLRPQRPVRDEWTAHVPGYFLNLRTVQQLLYGGGYLQPHEASAEMHRRKETCPIRCYSRINQKVRSWGTALQLRPRSPRLICEGNRQTTNDKRQFNGQMNSLHRRNVWLNKLITILQAAQVPNRRKRSTMRTHADSSTSGSSRRDPAVLHWWIQFWSNLLQKRPHLSGAWGDHREGEPDFCLREKSGRCLSEMWRIRINVLEDPASVQGFTKNAMSFAVNVWERLCVLNRIS